MTASAHNAADVAFASGMVPHHTQAVQMAELAATKATSPEVKALASKIQAAQQPEISQMTGWLRAWGEPVPEAGMTGGHEGHGMGAMPGMMDEREMKALQGASGSAFDAMWLEMMTRHHEGAVTMSKEEQASGANAEAKALAGRIASSQEQEIQQMKALLKKV